MGVYFKNRIVLLFAFLILGLSFFYLARDSLLRYPEYSELKGKNLSFKELSSFFKNVAEKKGASYAFELLKISSLPPQTDFHLLGHVVGDVLYKQQGAQGIRTCTQDFRNACSHSIVIGLFKDKGEEAMPEITEACRSAPGSKGAYNMCFHGLGHGVLASTGYDFPKTIELCKKTSKAPSGAEFIECTGGAVMEIISGGFHDRQIWSVKRESYLDYQNPLSLCYGSFMAKEAREICLVYLTPFLWEAIGTDIGRPDNEDFQKAFSICASIPFPQKVERDACFGGFGKEFVTLARARDIRGVDQISKDQSLKVYNWCGLAKIKEGIASCVISAVNSIYWGGENKKEGAINFCSAIGDAYQKNSCFISLIGAGLYFNRGNETKLREFCLALPSQYKYNCETSSKNYY